MEAYMHQYNPEFAGTNTHNIDLVEEQRDTLFSEAVVQLARAYSVSSENEFDDLVFEVSGALQHLRPDFTPSEAAVICARERLERTAGLVACSDALEPETEATVSQSQFQQRRHGSVPC